MREDNVITLSEYGSAVLLASMDCPFSCPREFKTKLVSTTVMNIKAKQLKVERIMGKEEFRIARYEYKRKYIDFIYNKLKEDYPDRDFAEVFMAQKDTQDWLQPLIEHTEKSLKCPHLEEDKCHCKRLREERNTSCYTCCFKCHINTHCEKACIYR